MPCHVFQGRAASQNSTPAFALTLCGECFCWMLNDPHFFFGRSLLFLTLSIIQKDKKNLYVGSFKQGQTGSNWYMDTGVRVLEVAFFKANST